MKPSDDRTSLYIYFDVKNNDKDPKGKVYYHVWISKFKNIFEKRLYSKLIKKGFVIKKVKNAVPWINAMEDFSVKELKKNFKKQIKQSLELKK